MHANNGDHNRAVADYTKAIEIDPNGNCYWQRGMAYFALGKTALAIADCREALKNYSDDVTGDFGLLAAPRERVADGHIKKKEYDDAIAIYSELLEIDPAYAMGYYYRAGAYRAKGDVVHAIADYGSAIEHNPNDALSYQNRARMHANNGDHNRAVADYTKAIEIDPNGNCYWQRGMAYFALGTTALAIADCREALKNYSDDVTGAFTILGEDRKDVAHEHIKRKEYDVAIAIYSELLEIDPAYARGYVRRAGAYRGKGDIIHAIEDYSKAIEHNKDYSVPYIMRGETIP